MRRIYYGEGLFLNEQYQIFSEHLEKKFQLLLMENHGVGIIGGYYEEGLPICMVSELSVKMLGYQSIEEFEEHTGKFLMRIICPSSNETFSEEKFAKWSGMMETHMYTASGERFWVRIFKMEHTSYDGRPIWLISICNMQELFEAECAIMEVNQKLEEANEQIRAQLDTFANGINGGYMISREDKQFSIAYVSQNVARNQGYTVKEFLDSCMGSALGNVYPPDRSEVMFTLTHQLKRKDSYSMKYRVICKDGNVKWVFDSGKRGKDKDGNPVIQSLIMDINDSEQMNMMYRQERRQYRDAITHDCEYSFSVDLTSGYLEDSFEMKNGENPIRLLGMRLPVRFDDYLERVKTVLKSVYTDGRALEDATTANLRQCYQMGIRKSEYDYWDIRQNKYVRATVLMSEREENGHICAIIVGRDISKQIREVENYHKEMQAANSRLECQKKELEAAYREANLANSAKSDFLARMSHDIRTPINGILGLIEMSDRYPDDVEKLKENREKERGAVKQLLMLVNDVLDMSKLESGEVELIEEPFNLNEQMKHCLELIEMQAHKREVKIVNRTPEGLRNADVIGSATYVNRILTNILSNSVKYNRIGGQIFIAMEELAQVEFAKCEFTGDEESRESAKAAKDEFTGSKSVDSPECGEQEKREELARAEFANSERRRALGNAKSEENKKSKKIWVRFLIEDTGIGMSEEFQQKMFEPFTQENDGGGERTHAGTGLGMAIVKKLTEKMGGTIEVHSRKHMGSAFDVRIPFVLDPSGGEEQKEAGEQADDGIRGKKLLLVEDNELNQEIARFMLTEAGAEIDSVWNGAEAVEVIRKSIGRAEAEKWRRGKTGKYDAILMDVMMPVMNGYEASREIRKLEKKAGIHTPIIAMTANAFVEDIVRCREAGMDEHIAKPLEIEKLITALAKYVKKG